MNHFLFTLPYPSSSLSPNRANGRKWQATYAMRRAAKEAAYCAVLEVLMGELPDIGRDVLFSATFTVHPPTARTRDIDNMLSSCKPLQDGVCAALGMDDKQIREVHIKYGDVKKHGSVVLELKPMEGREG